MMFKTGDIGPEVTDWRAPEGIPPMPLSGHWAELAPLTPEMAPQIFERLKDHPELWTYMTVGPFGDLQSFQTWIDNIARSKDPMFWGIRATGDTWAGLAAFMRITPKDGVVEIGTLMFAPAIQGTPVATEAMALMMRHAFESGFRRYEWKCNALNISSRRAAQRLGFSYEGTFRQHMVVKGNNRDTAWYAITDSDWSGLKSAFETWLSPANFMSDGKQRVALSELTRPYLVSDDPLLRT